MTLGRVDARFPGVFLLLFSMLTGGAALGQTYEELLELAEETLVGVQSLILSEEASLDFNGMAMTISTRSSVLAPSCSWTVAKTPMGNLEFIVDGESTVTVYPEQQKYVRSMGVPTGSGAGGGPREAEATSMIVTLDKALTSLKPLPGTMIEDLGSETLVLESGPAIPCRVMMIDADPEAAFGGALKPGFTVVSAKLWLGQKDGLVYRSIVSAEMDRGGAIMPVTTDSRVVDLDLDPELTPEDFVYVPEAGMVETTSGKQFVSKTLEGQPVPAVLLTTHDGRETALAGHLDGVTVVDFWATWCGPCRKELAELKTALADGSFDAPVVIISSEEESVVSAYVEKHGLPMTSLLDPGGVAAEAFSVSNFPTVFVVRADGTISDHFVGRVEVDVLRESVERARGAS